MDTAQPLSFFIDKLTEFKTQLQHNPDTDTAQVRNLRILFYRQEWTEEQFTLFQDQLRSIHDIVLQQQPTADTRATKADS
jgi:hypothetical protein